MSMPDSSNGFLWPDCRWLVFDAVGTLIHPEPSVAIAYQSIAARHGSRFTVGEVGERFRRAFRQSETCVFPNGPTADSCWFSSDAIELARWRWIVKEVVPDVDDVEKCFIELWDHFASPSSWSCFDDVGMALSMLDKAGFRLAIASNFDSRLNSVCEVHPALKAIECRFISSEMGFRKPAPEFYSLLISHCGCPANEILMIGDDPQHDVAGPISAGMYAVLLDRRVTNASPSSINSLQQLVSMSPEFRSRNGHSN